jgi:hypothetical protein
MSYSKFEVEGRGVSSRSAKIAVDVDVYGGTDAEGLVTTFSVEISPGPHDKGEEEETSELVLFNSIEHMEAFVDQARALIAWARAEKRDGEAWLAQELAREAAEKAPALPPKDWRPHGGGITSPRRRRGHR